MVELAKLHAFLFASESLSFSEAAKRLHLTQPTVSHHIRALENELGVELFIRSGSELQLTEAGRILTPWARRLIQQAIEMEEMMNSLQNKTAGSLRIACSTTAGKYILPQLAIRFKRQYPEVEISILPCTQENIKNRLLTQEVDLGVLSVELDAPDIESQLFFTDHISLIVNSDHPWAQRRSIEPANLLEEPIILREPTSGTRRILLSELSKYDISIEDLNVLIEIGNAEAIVMIIMNNLGISFVSRLASSYPRAWGSVIEVPVEGIDLHRPITIARSSLATPNRARETFWSFIHAPENEDLLILPNL